MTNLTGPESKIKWKKAIQHYIEHTCIRFQEINPKKSKMNFILIL